MNFPTNFFMKHPFLWSTLANVYIHSQKYYKCYHNYSVIFPNDMFIIREKKTAKWFSNICSIAPSFKALLLKKDVFILFEICFIWVTEDKQRERERERSSSHWFTPQTSATALVGPRQSYEERTPSGSPTWNGRDSGI